MTTDTSFTQRSIVWSRLGKTLAKTLVGLMLVGFLVVLSGANAQAQTTDTVCRDSGFLVNRENLSGIWKLTYSVGTTGYVTKLAIKGNAGASVTEFYDGSLRRKRRIKQIHVLCQSKVGVIILGYLPTDIDTNQTGENLSYSADNFVISRRPDGTIVAFNRDDAGTLAELDIEFIEELNK
ncbi:MAG TPA: hypothetical protein VF528_09160 [Pyrinomonadaceae bacterium]